MLVKLFKVTASRFRQRKFAWLVMIQLVLLCASFALAAPRPTTLTLMAPSEPQPMGERINFYTQLVNDENQPQANKVLVLYVNGQETRRARTAEDGSANLSISGDFPVGVYEIRIAFIGTKDYDPSEAQTTLTIRPMLLIIETVPPLPGVSVSLNEQVALSDEQGFVRFELTELTTYTLRVLLEPDTALSPDTRISFDRWNDAEFMPERNIKVGGDVHLQAGFKLSHLVSQNFVDLEGQPFHPSAVAEFTLKSSSGTYYTFEDNAPRWLPASRIQRYRAGLSVTPLQYSVESVMINGTNVVNRFQQRFYLKPNDIWRIQLLLYSARIRAKDAFFGFPVGTGILLSFPDGHSTALQFDPDKSLQTGLLARGEYKVKVVGVGGVTPATPVALSRNQDIELTVFSTLDIGVAITIGLLGAFGLLFYGRPHLIGLSKRKRSQARASTFPTRNSGLARDISEQHF
jgi:hypothetical protein